MTPNKIIEFEITIIQKTSREIETTEEILEQERHYTDAEINENHHWMRDSSRQDYTKKIYGRKPATATKTSETKVYSQIVSFEEFDIKKVIGAINDSQ